jgi:hypothetical protein
MFTTILAFEDPFMSMILNYAPSLGICIVLVLITAWASSRFNQYNNRLIRVEHDTGELKTDMKVVKKRLTRIERKLDKTILEFDQKLDKKLEERISPMEKKLDKLISYLVTTKQVDRDALG